MWKLNDYWANDQEVQQKFFVSPNTTIPSDVHVLLVDHERETLTSLSNLLQLLSYKVTVIGRASDGLAMLSERGEQFDVVFGNISSPDLQGFRLLEEAVNMGKETFLICTDEDLVLESRAFDFGAFIYVEKPVSIEFVKYLWEHVVKQRLTINAAESTTRNGRNIYSNESLVEDQNGGVEINDPKNKGKRRASDLVGHVRKKACTEWTPGHHAMYRDQLREGNDGLRPFGALALSCEPQEQPKNQEGYGEIELNPGDHFEFNSPDMDWQEMMDDNLDFPEVGDNSKTNSLDMNCQEMMDDYSNFPDMDVDSIVENISDLLEGFDLDQTQDQPAYGYNEVYPDQVAMEMEMDAKFVEDDFEAANSGNHK